MSKFALVSTVDTIGDDFPSHCVILFDTEDQAISYAVRLIEEYDDSVSVNDDGWRMNGDQIETECDLLDAFQSKLDLTEYFHVKPIAQAKGE